MEWRVCKIFRRIRGARLYRDPVQDHVLREEVVYVCYLLFAIPLPSRTTAGFSIHDPFEFPSSTPESQIGAPTSPSSLPPLREDKRRFKEKKSPYSYPYISQSHISRAAPGRPPLLLILRPPPPRAPSHSPSTNIRPGLKTPAPLLWPSPSTASSPPAPWGAPTWEEVVRIALD